MTSIECVNQIAHVFAVDKIRKLHYNRQMIHQRTCMEHPDYQKWFNIHRTIVIRRRFPTYKGPEQYRAATAEYLAEQLKILGQIGGRMMRNYLHNYANQNLPHSIRSRN